MSSNFANAGLCGVCGTPTRSLCFRLCFIRFAPHTISVVTGRFKYGFTGVRKIGKSVRLRLGRGRVQVITGNLSKTPFPTWHVLTFIARPPPPPPPPTRPRRKQIELGANHCGHPVESTPIRTTPSAYPVQLASQIPIRRLLKHSTCML